jgi:hypothetical protein
MGTGAANSPVECRGVALPSVVPQAQVRPMDGPNVGHRLYSQLLVGRPLVNAHNNTKRTKYGHDQSEGWHADLL